MPATVEFQRGKPFASVKSLHTISEVADMFTSTRQVIARAFVVCEKNGSFI